MKVRKIKCRTTKSAFAKLSCEEKLKVLNELSRGSKKIYRHVVKPTIGIEDKYYKICQCINECGAEELKFIKAELKKDEITISKLDNFRNNIFPLIISVLGLCAAVLNENNQSAEPNKTGNLILALFAYLVIYFLFYFVIGRVIESNAKKTAYILEIITDKHN